MERINMSLDDIMASKRSAGKNSKQDKPKPKVIKSKSSASGAKVRQPTRASQPDRPRRDDRPRRESESNVRINMPGQQSRVAEKQTLSVFARMGKPPVSGTRVTFANLKPSVREEDLRELCMSMGELKEVDFTVGRGGRNSAIVLFARRSEALNCVSSLNGMTLDGAPMEVSVTGEPVADAPKSVFQRLQGVPAVKNVRQGLFGTAMDDGEEMDDAPVHPRGGGPTFAVSLSAAAGGSTGARPQGKLVQPFSVPNESGRGVSFNQRGNEHNNSGNSRPRSDSNAGRYSQHDDRNERPARQQQQQNGGSGGGSRGGDRRGRGEGRREGRGAGKPQQRQQQQATANPKDLDAELDAYFASK